MGSNLYGVGLIIGMLFFCVLCIAKMMRHIPALGNPREKYVAGMLCALIFMGALTVFARLIDQLWLNTFGRAGMMVCMWVLNLYIIHYWTLVAKGKIE